MGENHLSKPCNGVPAINNLLLYEPHNMLISGVTNSGKTHFILDLLENEYRHKFDYIVILCPTYFNNTTYDRKWIYTDKKVLILNPSAIERSLDLPLYFARETFKDSNTLFIIDDCANLHDTKKKVSELCHLAFSGRHYGLTVWVLNQKYNSVVKDFRENIRVLVLFFNKDEKAMKQALEENHIIPKEKNNEIITQLKKQKGSKLILRLEQPVRYAIIN